MATKRPFVIVVCDNCYPHFLLLATCMPEKLHRDVLVWEEASVFFILFSCLETLFSCVSSRESQKTASVHLQDKIFFFTSACRCSKDRIREDVDIGCCVAVVSRPSYRWPLRLTFIPPKSQYNVPFSCPASMWFVFVFAVVSCFSCLAFFFGNVFEYEGRKK